MVYLGSPWVELGVLDRSAYLRQVRAVAEHMGEQGKRLVIRPHPGESASKYGDFKVIDTDLPAELDPAVVACAGAVGGTSTALLNLAALYGMPATRVVTGGLERLDSDLGSRQRRLLERYLPAPVTIGG